MRWRRYTRWQTVFRLPWWSARRGSARSQSPLFSRNGTGMAQEWQRSRTALLSLPGFDSPDRASSFAVWVSLSFDTLKADSRRVLLALSLHPAGATTELLGEILLDDVAVVPSTAVLVRKSLVEKTGTPARACADS